MFPNCEYLFKEVIWPVWYDKMTTVHIQQQGDYIHFKLVNIPTGSWKSITSNQ